MSIKHDALLMKKYKESSVFFARHALGVHTWSKMVDILNSVRENKRTVVTACHGASKTFTAAIAAIHWYNTKEEPTVITAAPTYRQVQSLLWRDINKLYKNSKVKLRGDCHIVHVRDESCPDDLFVGFSTDRPDTAEGFHGWNILFVLDEAKGIPPWLWDSVEAALAGPNARLLVLSTTDGVLPGSELSKAVESKRFNHIKIGCDDLPPFTDEKLKGIEWNDARGYDFKQSEKMLTDLKIQISTPNWEEDCIDSWGKDSYLHLTKCKGHIVKDLPDCCVKAVDVLTAFENYKRWESGDKLFADWTVGQKICGTDISREGEDETVFYLREGLVFTKSHMHRHFRVDQTVTKLKEFLNYDAEIEIRNDDGTFGGGVTDDMLAAGYNCIPIKFQQKPKNTILYAKLIDELWHYARDNIAKFAIPYDEILLNQLTSRMKIPVTTRGQRQVEPKVMYKKRMRGKSCDRADALLLALPSIITERNLPNQWDAKSLKKIRSQIKSNNNFNNLLKEVRGA